MTNKISGIYALLCPITDRVMYVGQSKNIRKRYSEHLRNVNGAQPVSLWMRDLKNNGMKPSIKVLEATSDLNDRERHWISRYKPSGILNVMHGGQDVIVSKKKPWAVVSVSSPTRMYMIMCRNMDIDTGFVKDAIKKCRSIEERICLEGRFAEIMRSAGNKKAEIWIDVMTERIRKYYPEIEVRL